MKKSPASSKNQPKKAKKAKNSKQTAAGNVRIIGGQYKRRNVNFIDADGLRPTPDRLRETLFNWLLADIHGARVLDSCAGSGVLGFEALSRGAAHCSFIEANLAQSQMLLRSAEQLHIDAGSYQILHGAAQQILSQNQQSQPFFPQPFDIVFIDPPYAEDLWQPILTALIIKELITVETLIYLEADKDLSGQLDELVLSLGDTLTAQRLSGFECIKNTKVGQVVAGLYRLVSS
ncbi:16S rRNA (guanine(966)-N(2))-methyltransferase RsmD [Psychrobacter sp. LV10R520-6]|uniref:16S rRNA (guanine(966)-N(2))-methyltransferase RsmD n=1 Tax=Psychrobacter sp. LV10R520-6 TaxID=1415574 RepID=UPI0024CAEA85|nr:16S rRNA (guanine(966)-N(2))-methyltransferase RsmD [Psychrobacter sp. LV10R520-6]SNT69285.1 16S rRNA (guanine966-N2)-methyltransferase [Psychrobacter sp. LV10R520-6]